MPNLICRAITDLEPDDVAELLFDRILVRVTIVAVQKQAVVDGVDRDLRCPPLAHGGFGRVRKSMVAQPQRLVAE